MVTVYNASGKHSARLAGIIFIFVGIIFAAVGTFVFISEKNLKTRMTESTIGTIIDEGMHYDNDGDRMFSPIYQYRVNGELYECSSNSSSSSRPSTESTVYFDPSNVSECQSDYARGTSTFMYILFIALGGFLAVIGVIVSVIKQKS